MSVPLSMLESSSDRKIFFDLYNKYENAMLGVARRYFPDNPCAAEDAVQNAWLKTVENFSKIRQVPCKKRGAYLVTITKNEAISILRKRRYELPFDESFADKKTELGDYSAKPVTEIIQTMPDTYQTVLEMRFIWGRSTKEIAAALHLKESTVSVRIHRGRALLIEKLREEGYMK